MPRPRDVTYGPTRFLTSREKPLNFSMFFADIEKMTSEMLSDADDFERSRTIVYQELGVLGKDVLEPVWSAAAPQHEWGGNGPRVVLLKDEIHAVRTRRQTGLNPSIRIEMPWWGKYSIQGRPELGDRPGGGMWKMVLPGGQVIFRRFVGRATVRAYSAGIGPTGEMITSNGARSHHGKNNPLPIPPPFDRAAAAKRKMWSSDAYRDLKASGQLEVTLSNIAKRIILESSLYIALGARENTSELRKLLADFKKNTSGGSLGRTAYNSDSVRHGRSHRTAEALAAAKRRAKAHSEHAAERAAHKSVMGHQLRQYNARLRDEGRLRRNRSRLGKLRGAVNKALLEHHALMLKGLGHPDF